MEWAFMGAAYLLTVVVYHVGWRRGFSRCAKIEDKHRVGFGGRDD